MVFLEIKYTHTHTQLKQKFSNLCKRKVIKVKNCWSLFLRDFIGLRIKNVPGFFPPTSSSPYLQFIAVNFALVQEQCYFSINIHGPLNKKAHIEPLN